MQQKNFVVFMITCVIILVGWMWLQNQIWPPQPPAKDAAKKLAEKKKKDKEKGKIPPKKSELEIYFAKLPPENQQLAAFLGLASPTSLAAIYDPQFLKRIDRK